jgi:hypothetical protein
MFHHRGSLVIVVVLGACSDDEVGGGGGAICDAVRSCVVDAVAALEACAPVAALTLGTPTNTSGTVNNLMCTGGEQTVAFSTFSFSATGTVPLPSTITLSTAGAMDFESSIIERPDAAPVRINKYANGDFGVECDMVEPVASPSMLASCATQLQRPVIERNADITLMKMQLADAAGASVDLFACTR